MNKLFQWVFKPQGTNLVQAEGYFLGYFFYFRATNVFATIEFFHSKYDFDREGGVNILKGYIVKNRNNYDATQLSKEESYFLIFKGCVRFLFCEIIPQWVSPLSR